MQDDYQPLRMPKFEPNVRPEYFELPHLEPEDCEQLRRISVREQQDAWRLERLEEFNRFKWETNKWMDEYEPILKWAKVVHSCVMFFPNLVRWFRGAKK